jgi:hypothetical protein
VEGMNTNNIENSLPLGTNKIYSISSGSVVPPIYVPAIVRNPQSGTSESLKIKLLLDCGLIGNEYAVINPLLINTLALKTNTIKRVSLTLGDATTKLKIIGKTNIKLEIGPHVEIFPALIANVDEYLILGMKWLDKHNPIINWKERHITFDSTCIADRHISQKTKVWVREEDFLGFRKFSDSIPVTSPEHNTVVSSESATVNFLESRDKSIGFN